MQKHMQTLMLDVRKCRELVIQKKRLVVHSFRYSNYLCLIKCTFYFLFGAAGEVEEQEPILRLKTSNFLQLFRSEAVLKDIKNGDWFAV